MREISLPPSETPRAPRTDPPAVKIANLFGAKVENLTLIGIAAAALFRGLCDWPQFCVFAGVVCGLANLGPLAQLTRGDGPRSLLGLLAFWWRR